MKYTMGLSCQVELGAPREPQGLGESRKSPWRRGPGGKPLPIEHPEFSRLEEREVEGKEQKVQGSGQKDRGENGPRLVVR